eukprot:symbB.v1.2.007069.t1/scaffold414.1/size398445/33
MFANSSTTHHFVTSWCAESTYATVATLNGMVEQCVRRRRWGAPLGFSPMKQLHRMRDSSCRQTKKPVACDPAQMDAVHDVLDTKVNEKPFEDLKHCTASLTRGVVKFAQVVGVFPGPKFDDAEGADQGEADVELLGWEELPEASGESQECAENLSFRVDKAWRQRCSQRFRNVLDMIAKKADHSVLRLLQISQQHIESQLERVKHERELWKEVVERRQQQPLQLALSMKEQTSAGPSQ